MTYAHLIIAAIRVIAAGAALILIANLARKEG